MKHDWMACDGQGGHTQAARSKGSCEGVTNQAQIALTRRQLLVGAALGAVMWAGRGSALAQIAVSPSKKRRNIFVSIFLRGGLDALNAVVPYREDAYHRSRPSLGLGAPGDATKSASDRVLDLDGLFGLHPSLAPLLPLYRDGQLAVLHAVGSGDETRSHFEAMATMEHGLDSTTAGAESGWLARHLQQTASENDSPLRAVALSSVMPDSLRGATHAAALASIDDFRLIAGGEEGERFRSALGSMYGTGSDVISEAGRDTLEVLKSLNRVDPKQYRPLNGAKYPESELGEGLKQIALLIRADVGLEVAFLDKGGWDTHVAQAQLLTGNLDDLGKSLAAFSGDLGLDMNRVTVVVQTEFGRRLQENTGHGTDHGHGGVMFLLGGGVAGGKVHGRWPGLGAQHLAGPGDLQVTTDYRAVLAEVLEHRCSNPNGSSVFSGLRGPKPAIVRA